MWYSTVSHPYSCVKVGKESRIYRAALSSHFGLQAVAARFERRALGRFGLEFSQYMVDQHLAVPGATDMSVDLSRPFAALIWAILAAAPFAVWLLIYWILKHGSVDRSRILPFLKVLRVITWAVAMVLIFFAIINDSFSFLFVFGFGILSFSTGLSFPQSWLKKKMGVAKDPE